MPASMAQALLRSLNINMVASFVLTTVSSSGCGGSNPNTGSLNLSQPNIEPIDPVKLQNDAIGALTQGAAGPPGDYQWMHLSVLADKDLQGESFIHTDAPDTRAEYP